MIAVDTSVVVAAFASWHELHGAAAAVLDRRARLPAQCALETYSVLTRLPPPHRAPAGLVREFLEEAFPDPYLTLATERYGELIEVLARTGIVGGATYDALVGVSARDAGATLVTCDRRARTTYERMGVAIEFVG